MFTIDIDEAEIALVKLSDALALTQINEMVLGQLQAGSVLSEGESSHPVWGDEQLKEKTAQRLAQSIPSKMPIDVLPTLPDQLALLLRSELTLAHAEYPLEAAEKDNAEQLLQDLTRPIVYHLIERHYAGQPADEPAKLITQVISQTITIGWQTVKSGRWNIHLLDSRIGGVGYRFHNGQETIYSEGGMTAEGSYFIELAQTLAEAMCAIKLL